MIKKIINKIADIMNTEEQTPNEEVNKENDRPLTEVENTEQQKDILMGKEEPKPVEKASKEIRYTANNSIEIRKNLIESIVNVLLGVKYGKNYSALHLYLTEEANILAVSSILDDTSFENDLWLQLDNAGLNPDKDLQWKYFSRQNPPEKASKVGRGLWLALPGKSDRHIGSKAKIKAIAGRLQTDEYMLTQEGKAYNIGRGENPRLDNGRNHQNHIVIAEDDLEGITPGDIQLNKHVSRAHAVLVYDVGNGFALQVLHGGMFTHGNRTRILRAWNIVIDVNNTLVTYPLESGDQIELGKSVILLFELFSDTTSITL